MFFDNLFLNETDEYTHTTKEKYDEIKKSYDGLFEQDENGNYYLVDNFDFKRLIKFYEVTWNKAFELIQYDTVYVNVMNEINKIRNIDKMNLYLSISLVSLIFFLNKVLFEKCFRLQHSNFVLQTSILLKINFFNIILNIISHFSFH